ncbi:CDP-glycerol glycerophosphotransferase family protein [Latilactobacillus curvatus]|uniref:CDP-glycerol glycerophosphotransferase family protein n=1 Tax=Latilactobacillus curvatus TaxID=28038 RepID=UPI0038856424
MKKILIFLINYLFPSYLFPIKKNKIIFDSFRGKGFSGNGKYVTFELLKKNENLDIVWLDNQSQDKYPDGIRVVKYNSIKSLFELATAKIWVDDFRMKYAPLKKKKQKYFQLWHGTVALKKVEKDVEDKLTKEYVDSAKLDGKRSDYMVSGSKFMTNLYKESFWFNGQVLELGTPNVDLFFEDEHKAISYINELYGLKNEKIILYAPTFRDSNDKSIYNLPFKKILEHLNEEYKGKWKFVIKLHPNDVEYESGLVDNELLLPGAICSDIQQLILRSDLIITDYSSLMFDAILKNKKVLLYTPDFENYLNKERGFYWDFSSLPFPKADTIDELYTNIDEFNENQYLNKVDKFNDKIGRFEKGTASKAIADYIVNLTKE